MKSYPRAEAELRHAIALESGQAISYSDLADLLVQVERSNEPYRKALLQDSALGEANLGLGILLVDEGRKAEGKQYCAKAAMNTDLSIQDEARTCLKR